MSDYPKPKKTHASNSARLIRLGKSAKQLKNDNSTLWVGLNSDRGNASLFVAAYDDENGFTPVEGYFRTMSDAVSELEGVLNADSLPRYHAILNGTMLSMPVRSWLGIGANTKFLKK